MQVTLVMLLATVALVFAAPQYKREEEIRDEGAKKEVKHHDEAMNAGWAAKSKNTINAKQAMMSLYAHEALSSFAAEQATTVMAAEHASKAENAESAEEAMYAMKAGEAKYAKYAYIAGTAHGQKKEDEPGKHAKEMLESVLGGLEGMVEETVKSLAQLKEIEEQIKEKHGIVPGPAEQMKHGVVGTADKAYNTLNANNALNAINAEKSKHSALAQSAHMAMMAKEASQAMFAREAEQAMRAKAAGKATYAMFALTAEHAMYTGTKEELKKLVKEKGDNEEAEEADVWKHAEPENPAGKKDEMEDEMESFKEEMENFHPVV